MEVYVKRLYSHAYYYESDVFWAVDSHFEAVPSSLKNLLIVPNVLPINTVFYSLYKNKSNV